jgi:hypothetical protein
LFNQNKNVFWNSLSQNPNAIHILEQNMDKVDWGYLCCNPNIFVNENEYFLK